MADFHISEDKDCGKWTVTREGADNPSDLAKTQRDAERIARRLTAKTGGGKVCIHGPDGKVRKRKKVKPARDPSEPGENRE